MLCHTLHTKLVDTIMFNCSKHYLGIILHLWYLAIHSESLTYKKSFQMYDTVYFSRIVLCSKKALEVLKMIQILICVLTIGFRWFSKLILLKFNLYLVVQGLITTEKHFYSLTLIQFPEFLLKILLKKTNYISSFLLIKVGKQTNLIFFKILTLNIA